LDLSTSQSWCCVCPRAWCGSLLVRIKYCFSCLKTWGQDTCGILCWRCPNLVTMRVVTLFKRSPRATPHKLVFPYKTRANIGGSNNYVVLCPKCSGNNFVVCASLDLPCCNVCSPWTTVLCGLRSCGPRLASVTSSLCNFHSICSTFNDCSYLITCLSLCCALSVLWAPNVKELRVLCSK